MGSAEGDIIFDPFGGSGTNYLVAGLKNRRWLGIELGSTEIIRNRLSDLEEEKKYLESLRRNYSLLFPENIRNQRIKKGLWTAGTFANS